MTVVTIVLAPNVLSVTSRIPLFDYFGIWFVVAVATALLDTFFVLVLTHDLIGRRAGWMWAAVENLIVLTALIGWSLAALPMLAFGLVAFGSG